MNQISSIITSLSKKRPIFHSEADFQHALAWDLHLNDSEASIRLEHRKKLQTENAYIDLTATVKERKIAIELKYKTSRLKTTINGEIFDLAAQGAQDVATRLFWDDVSRLEQLTNLEKNSLGYAVFLTNDSSYWTDSGRSNTNANAYRLYEGRTVKNQLAWGENTGPGTMKGREKPIELIGEYKLEWKYFSTVEDQNFRYLLLEVSCESLEAAKKLNKRHLSP
jgi:hypothetical protein